MKTNHKIIYENSQSMQNIKNESVDLIVTSPPYPMIAMWDKTFFNQNQKVKDEFEKKNYENAFELMHKELDKVWEESYRVLKNGGMACINIGDASRTFNSNFRLFPNHSRILKKALELGFYNLPNIIWRKQTNAPNKFMGSGMLPPGAYVTLEHEYILIFRKGYKREFKEQEKEKRRTSAYFWEERNDWFSDLWNIKGTRQKVKLNPDRTRSGAFPFEIPYRLINMYSLQEDLVLDPFLGTGTTTIAAIAANRNSIGFEIDKNFKLFVEKNITNKNTEPINEIIQNRLIKHKNFITERKKEKGNKAFKYINKNYDFEVMTKQETNLKIPFIYNIDVKNDEYIATYYKQPTFKAPNSMKLF